MATPQLKQENRLLQLKSPLEADRFVLNGFSGSESLSGLFRFKLDLLAAGYAEVDVLSLYGKPVRVTMQDGSQPRYFNGIISRISAGGTQYTKNRERAYQSYTAEVVPWLWLLTQRAGCRIFQNLSVLDIITSIFEEYKIGIEGSKETDFGDLVDYRDTTTGTHISLDYCVQYRETDFNFVSRLMEQEGISYYFDHTAEGHTMILRDDSLFPAIDGNATVRFAEFGYGEREDTISRWEHQWTVRPSRYRLRDYHFELPGKEKDLEVDEGGFSGEKDSLLEIYDYPGEYTARFNKTGERLGDIHGEGAKFVKVRMQEEELFKATYEGSSNCRRFSVGHNFKREDPSETGALALVNNEFTLVSVSFSAAQIPDYLSGADASRDPYRNSFVCVLAGQTVPPRRVTPKPVVSGPQTATVCVKAGEESWLDKYGRVRVQFHWDREGKNDENSSCWLRVAQPWAGTAWGAHFWPRWGQEVLVQFLEGDPDQPIIVGSLYNAANMPPYELPKFYTRSGIISRSSKDGKTKNFNEIRLEDKAGSEQLFFNAERDMDERVEHDMREFVGCNQHLIVGASQFQAIGGEKHEHVKKDHLETIDGDASRTVKGDHM